MASSEGTSGVSTSQADERRPLLANGQAQPGYNGAPRDQEDGSAGQDEGHSVPVPEEMSNKRLALTLGSIYVGVFLAALDSTIIATLTTPISTSFRSLSLLSWLASAYLIANAAFQPVSGRLTDIFSRRTGLLFSNIFFGVGNLICGLATKQWVMITGRVVAGMGGGGLFAISTFVASDIVPLRKRGLIQGIGNVCYGVGAGLGGLFGGWVNDVWNWRVAFLSQVPLVLLSAILVYFLVDIPPRPSAPNAPSHPLKRIDFLGAFTLVATLVLLLLGLNSGGNLVPWTHPLVLTTIPLSLVLLLIFIYTEAYLAAEPIIPVRLLLHRTVFSACLANWFTTMVVFSLLFYAPLYFQLLGLSTTQAGIHLIPISVGTSLGSLTSGLIMNLTGKYYLLNLCFASLFLLGTALTCTIHLSTPSWPPLIYLLLTGLGYGSALTVTLLALISAVDQTHQAVITSASYAFRSTGSTIGITIASAVFQNILKMKLWQRFGDRTDAGEVIGRIRDSFDEIRHLPDGWEQGVKSSYMDALRGVFITSLGLAVLGTGISLLMREHVLHKTLARR